MRRNFLILAAIALLVVVWTSSIGFTLRQAIVAGTFLMTILGVLFFWELRLSFVFLGAGVVLLIHAIDLKNLILFASLDVILFLIGMMLLVGVLNDVGFFNWLVMRLLRIRNLTGGKLFLLLMVISAALSGLMGEVASIIIMMKIILDLCDFFDADPVPFILSSVFTTNIGSSGTVLGNPIGILIAARGNLTFEDFMRQAFPITLLVFIPTVAILYLIFRKSIRRWTEQLKSLRDNSFFFKLISIPTDRKTKISIGIFAATLLCITLHHRLELFFGLEENTLLMILPIFFAGIALLYRSDRMRHYVEHEVEWASILFFLFLFALAGVIKYSGISDLLAQRLVSSMGRSMNLLTGVVIFSSGIFSSVMDNTVVVASYIPVIQSLGNLNVNSNSLWWAILFGACYGGNITVIGSTANIVAMDILEKKKNIRIHFFQWLKIGAVVGLLSMSIAYFLLLLLN